MASSAAAPREDRTSLGVAFMCAAVFCFTTIDSSAKWLILAGLPAIQVVFARYAGAFVVSLLLFLPQEGLGAFRSRAPKLQALRAAFLLISTIFNFLALRSLPISVTTTIFFASPIVVTLLSVPILGEKVGMRRLLAVLAGFSGVLVVIQPWGAEWHPAMLLSLGALVCASLYFVLTRRLAGTESNATSQLWVGGLGTVVLAPVALPIWVWPDTLLGMAVLSWIGAFGALGHIFATTAHRYALASTLAPVVYTQLLFATLAGYFVFGSMPSVFAAAVAGTELAGRPRRFISSVLETVIEAVAATPANSPFPTALASSRTFISASLACSCEIIGL
ncbi:hypothetical protein LCGC14_2373970, partial [marine sediment metagenome]